MDINFNKNEDFNKLQLSELKKRLLKVYKGGGDARIEKYKAKGKLTARERIEYLFDKDSDLSFHLKTNDENKDKVKTVKISEAKIKLSLLSRRVFQNVLIFFIIH